MRIIILTLLVCLASIGNGAGQNVGIGTREPYNRLHIEGNLLVTAPTLSNTAQPTAAQTIVMEPRSTIQVGLADSVVRIYDPGGAGGDYGSSQLSNVGFNSASLTQTAFEVTIESIGLDRGDSLIITTGNVVLLAVGDGYYTTGKWVFGTRHLNVLFKSNLDFMTGPGFSILLRRLYRPANLPLVAAAKTTAMFFDVSNYTFRAGELSTAETGPGSVGIGYLPVASGSNSIAIGYQTRATGFVAIAMGNSAIASGNWATALGNGTEASGGSSTALGYQTIASGGASTAIGDEAQATGTSATAIGRNVTASGNYSTALGNNVSTSGEEGSLVIGDNSSSGTMNAATPNSFRARFAGGYRFYTSSDLTTNALLSAGSNAWSTASDKRLKENFLELDGESFLQKIAAMKLSSWNYKQQDATKFRHYGPMAQDFYTAFGNDGIGTIGNDTTINQADFDGVNLVAIQALVKRTEEQQKEIALYKEALEILKKEVAALKKTQAGKN